MSLGANPYPQDEMPYLQKLAERRRHELEEEEKAKKKKEECAKSIPFGFLNLGRFAVKNCGPPPIYADINKPCKDLFTRGYNFGFLKVDTKTTAAGKDIELKLGAAHSMADGKFKGTLESKYKVKEQGLTLTKKWHTGNVFELEVEVADKFRKGAKLNLISTIAMHTGVHSHKIKTEMLTPRARFNAETPLSAQPLLQASAVFGMSPYTVGFHSAFDAKTNQLAGASATVAFHFANGSFASNTINDKKEIASMLYHKLDKSTEIGAMINWKFGAESARFGLAGKYDIDKNWTIKGKVFNDNTIAFLSQHMLNDHVKLTASAETTVGRLYGRGEETNDNKVKFGLGFEYEPKECC